jgi:multimeric flavodoxin WrbA
MTEVLAVAASARRGGNSDAVLEAALDAMRERGASVETIYPRQLDVTPCMACNGCWETGVCVIKKDAMRELYERFEAVDHVVAASPLYFTSLPGHFKVLIDRFQPYWVRTYRLSNPPGRRRRGMFLCVGAMEKELYFNCTLRIVRTWLSCVNMDCDVMRFYPGVDARKDLVEGHPEYLEDARQAAVELMEGGD